MSTPMDNYVNLSSSDSVEWSGEALHHASGSSSSSYAEGIPITFSMIYFPHLQPPNGQSLLKQKLPAFATRHFNVNMPFRTTLIDKLQSEIPVTLQKMDACLEITDGWVIFRDAHGIKPRDFFEFNLFEDHSMERLHVPVAQFLPQECKPMTLSFGGKT
ncbi:hypothetical protein COLO4_28113 [Corchorus olitorius]|uniref:TF-B3 domain-containing protein n=1 Tax=Corchorus olitorius TaxID=93759 RepID=A0A1R3HN88_9ROSI|nr:hypothetical protein COLO4_28113 [Corchorus olitorius]